MVSALRTVSLPSPEAAAAPVSAMEPMKCPDPAGFSCSVRLSDSAPEATVTPTEPAPRLLSCTAMFAVSLQP